MRRFPSPKSCRSNRSIFLAVLTAVGGFLSFAPLSPEEPMAAPLQESPIVVTMTGRYYPTKGRPFEAMVHRRGLVFVSLSSDLVVDKCPAPTPTVGIQLFQPGVGGYSNPCEGRGAGVINLPKSAIDAPVSQVFGMKFYPGNETALGAAVERQGVDLVSKLDVAACRSEGVVNVQQPPRSAAACGGAPGTFDLAFKPDGAYAFVANEYGTLPGAEIVGTVGVVAVHRSSTGRFDLRSGLIPRNPYIHIPGATTIAGVTMSRDGRRLYVTTEVARRGFQDPTRSRNPLLTKDNCYQGQNGPSHNGLLTVIDVQSARAGLGQLSILRTIASGCSPVRIAETADGKTIWVAARGDNRVLAFDVAKLLSDAPNTSLAGHAASGGAAPVGLALFDKDQLLAVANSDRFNVKGGVSGVAILDVRAPSRARVISRLDAKAPNTFPRSVNVGPDDRTLFVTHFNSNQLQVIQTQLSGGR